MVTADRPPRNGFVAAMRKVYNPIGFSKGYNAVLWFIFDGALLGFILARMMYFNYWGTFCNPNAPAGNSALPGECYQYSRATYRRVGIQLHLFTILPAGFLAVLQFIPAIRHHAMILHRVIGYLAILCAIVGTVGALMIARFAFGGGLEIQAVIGLLAVLFIGGLAMAYYNIKTLQIEQHRAWMLRAWFWAGTIISARLIMFAAAAIISLPGMGPYYKPTECEVIFSLISRDLVLSLYPVCSDPNAYALVQANWNQGDPTPEQIAAAFDLTFGMSMWLALAIHTIGVETYLRLTPAEFERLRRVSYEKQRQRGWKRAGSAGFVPDRYGDGEKWMPPAQRGAMPEREPSDSPTLTTNHREDKLAPSDSDTA